MLDMVVLSQLLHVNGYAIPTKEDRFESEGSGEGYADVENFGLNPGFYLVSSIIVKGQDQKTYLTSW